MKEKYKKYSFEELIEDKHFIAWVLRGSNKNEWKKFIVDNPVIKEKVKKARRTILLLRDNYEVLDEESILKMGHNIYRFEQQHKKKVRTIKRRRGLSWAASVLLIFSAGTIGYFYLNEKDTDYQFVSSENVTQGNEARLVLSDGEEIQLNSDNSTISLNNENELKINNDSIIDLSKKENELDNVVQMNEVIIPYGKKSELLLADGTIVWLNAGSRLAFPSKFTKKTREVYLEGEACFKVVSDENQPFIVKAGQLEIKVLGTLFDISAYSSDENIETILINGSVAVSKPNSLGLGRSEIILKPYQRASFQKQKNDVIVSEEPNAELYIAWTEGWLQFSHESLQSVFAKLERYYNVEIRTSQNFLSSELITGKLDLKESLQDVMITLSDVTNIEYRINGNKIYIDKKFKDSLAGRKKILKLTPFNFSEFLIAKGETNFAEKIKQPMFMESNSKRKFLLPERKRLEIFWNEYIVYGGYPKIVLENDHEEKQDYLKELYQSFLKKDVLDSGVKEEIAFYKLIKILASQIGQLVNNQELARTIGVSGETISKYLYVLQKSFIIQMITTFSGNIRKELVKMPKVFFFDTGYRNALLNSFTPWGDRLDKGELLENSVFAELTKNLVEDIKFWRTQDKQEIDFIINEKYAFEVKLNKNNFKTTKYKNFKKNYPNVNLNLITFNDLTEPDIFDFLSFR